MKLIKNNLKFITGLIIGGVIFSGVTVLASTILSKDVGYTPNDNSFNVSNVEKALDKLYEMNEFNETIENAECISGTFTCGTVDCTNGYVVADFVPSKAVFFTYKRRSNSNVSSLYSYDVNFNPTQYAYFGTDNTTNIRYNTITGGIIDFSNNNTKLNVDYGTWYYFICR